MVRALLPAPHPEQGRKEEAHVGPFFGLSGRIDAVEGRGDELAALLLDSAAALGVDQEDAVTGCEWPTHGVLL
jgi:hypothetical protein